MRTLRWIVLLGVMGTLAVADDVAAQHAVPRPRPAVVHARPYYGGAYHHYPYYRPYYYAPYYYAPYYGYGFGFGVGFSFGWPGWYGGPYYAPYYAGYPYGGHYYYDYSAARLQVTPRQAEVFIDGHFVGLVDDFDGWSQRLTVAPGEHTLEIFLGGHHTFRQNVLFRPGATLKVGHVMQPLQPGEAADPRPTPSPSARQRPASQTYPEQPDDRVPAARRSDIQIQAPRDVESREYGSLAIRVQPMDAQVLVDGETWQSPEAGSLTLQLTDGPHRIEVRKEGFKPYSAEVRVRRGDTTSLNVSLSR